MLAIKFKRIGKRHQATYRVVVAEKRAKFKGRYVEDLGWFNPHSDEFDINKERAKYWLGVGAAPTDSVFNLLVKGGVTPGPKRSVHKISKKAPMPETPKTAAVESTLNNEARDEENATT